MWHYTRHSTTLAPPLIMVGLLTIAVAGREALRRILEERRGRTTRTRTRTQGSASGNLSIIDEALSSVRPRRLITREGVLSPCTNNSGAHGSSVVEAKFRMPYGRSGGEHLDAQPWDHSWSPPQLCYSIERTSSRTSHQTRLR
jgi:hypothetical protein